ncbi:cytochrome P450 [Zychaea mexicana]|uniref:cytochrome P450 n=1 Tax=Zychaea mexicana TaxID=64656 RepID=UPI0022FE4F3F|nr:cytochrome P450 [Zychaea mexicana]KAI9494942.1 cytochrome P450 [Zychaea mexicana]
MPRCDWIGTLAGRLLLGPNILFLAGEQWKEQRKVINPAFHRSMPIQLFGRLSQKMLDVMEQETGPVDIHAMSQRWALDVLGESAFGFQFHALDDRDTNEWVTRYNCVVESAQKPFYFMFPSIERRFKTWIPERNKAHGELSIFLNMMSSIAEKKRQALVESSSSGPNSSGSKLAANDQEKDLLTLMIEAEQEGQGRLSDEELQSNLSVFFLAGHETTAAAIAFAIYHLAVNSDIQQRAREEVTRIFGDGYDILPTVEQTRELDYLNRVIKETLRMEPPAVSMVPRIATQDTELSGVFIPKGTRLTVDLYELHHNPEVWKDPDQFDPDRFAPGGESDVMADGMPWAPFSNGSRQCIGMNFSLMEQRVLLPMLLMKYEWRLPENSIHKEKVITNGLGVIKPIDLKVIFTKRY